MCTIYLAFNKSEIIVDNKIRQPNHENPLNLACEFRGVALDGTDVVATGYVGNSDAGCLLIHILYTFRNEAPL